MEHIVSIIYALFRILKTDILQEINSNKDLIIIKLITHYQPMICLDFSINFFIK